MKEMCEGMGVMLACLVTKAVAILACPGNKPESFWLTYRRFCGIFSEPTKVDTDPGPQIKAHAEKEGVKLSNIAKDATRNSTEWCFTPKACSWRNGQAEICIRLARHTLAHTLARKTDMTYQMLEIVLIEVAATINTRPIAIKYKSYTEYV